VAGAGGRSAADRVRERSRPQQPEPEDPAAHEDQGGKQPPARGQHAAAGRLAEEDRTHPEDAGIVTIQGPGRRLAQSHRQREGEERLRVADPAHLVTASNREGGEATKHPGLQTAHCHGAVVGCRRQAGVLERAAAQAVCERRREDNHASQGAVVAE